VDMFPNSGAGRRFFGQSRENRRAGVSVLAA